MYSDASVIWSPLMPWMSWSDTVFFSQSLIPSMCQHSLGSFFPETKNKKFLLIELDPSPTQESMTGIVTGILTISWGG